MYESDFIKRMIQQVTQLAARVLAKILGLIEEKKYPEALLEIENAYRDFYGMDGRMLLSLSAEALIEILSSEGQAPEAAKLFVLAELLKLEGDIHLGESKQTAADKRYLAALDLFLETALQTGITEGGGKESLVETLAASLKPAGLPVELRLNLMQYYEFDRQYGKAEDALFELIDEDRVGAEAIQAGIRFYQRLLEKTDQELADGEIYRDEVKEGLEELQKLGDKFRPGRDCEKKRGKIKVLNLFLIESNLCSILEGSLFQFHEGD